MSTEPTFEPDRLVAALNAAGWVRDRRRPCLQALGGEHPIQGSVTEAARARPASFKVQTKHGEVQVLNRMEGVPPFAELQRDQIRVEIASDAIAPVAPAPA